MPWSDVRHKFKKGGVQEFAERMCQYARENRWSKNSRSSYKTAHNSWLEFCRVAEVNPTCRHANGRMWSVQETVAHVNTYVAIQCGMRSMHPASIRKTYLPGIVATFEIRREVNNFENAVAQKDVKLILEGCEKMYLKMHPVAETVKIAFGMDLALCSKETMKTMGTFREDPRHMDLKQKRMFVVMCVGIYFMLRKSEHISKKDGSPAGLKRAKVTFLDYNNRPIPYERIGKPGYRAKKVCIPTDFSKTDFSGFGRRPWHVRQEDVRKKDVCIVQILEDWIATTRDMYGAKAEDELYDVPGIEKVTAYRLHQVMRSAVRSYTGDVPIGRIATSHSLRYGGATMMAAAGFPQYLIAHYGGWKADSEALKKYVRPSDESIERVSRYMTDVALAQPSRHYINDAIAVYQSRKSSK